jgi:hypothetical protein
MQVSYVHVHEAIPPVTMWQRPFVPDVHWLS